MRTGCLRLAACRTPAAALVAFLVARASPAQQFGQWSWDGSLGAAARGYRNTIGETTASSLDERELNVSLGVSGFVLHPAIARFRLGLDTAFSRYESTRELRTRRWGAAGNVNVLPYGTYPLTVYASRHLYDYSRLAEEDPLNLLGIPDMAATIGGRLRARSGPLGGTLFGYERDSLTYEDPGLTTPLRTRAFADWSGASQAFSRHFRLERRTDRFGVVDYRIRDWTADYDQRGRINPSWRWEMLANGFRRAVDISGGGSTFHTARTSQRFLRPLRRRDRLDLGYDFGLTGGSGPALQSHNVLVRYEARPDGRWVLAPFGGYGLQIRGDTRVHAPQAGLGATWSGRAGSWALVANESVGLLRTHLRGDGVEKTDTTLALSAGLTAGHGVESGLRKELDVSWSRNRLRVAGEAFPSLPDSGASIAGVGTEERLRGRVSLGRRLGAVSLYAFTEGDRRRPSGSIARGAAIDTLTFTLQAGGRTLTISGNAGESRVRGRDEQEFRFLAASLAMRPFRVLSLTGSYRTDRRDLKLAPGVDGKRYEAGANIWLGAFVVDGHLFRTTERSPDAPARTNRGAIVSVSRRFSGWLPFVTGPVRGGVVR